MKNYLLSVPGLLVCLLFYHQVNAAPTSLDGSIWTGSGQSRDGTLTYTFSFNQDNLALKTTCQIAEISSTMKSELVVRYSDDGSTAELVSGFQSIIPAGQGSCTVNFPASLKFELDHDQIFIEYDGSRRLTQMKRQN